MGKHPWLGLMLGFVVGVTSGSVALSFRKDAFIRPRVLQIMKPDVPAGRPNTLAQGETGKTESDRPTFNEVLLSNTRVYLWPALTSLPLTPDQKERLCNTLVARWKRNQALLASFAAGDDASYPKLEAQYGKSEAEYREEIAQVSGQNANKVFEEFRKLSIRQFVSEISSCLSPNDAGAVFEQKLTEQFLPFLSDTDMERFFDPYALPQDPVKRSKLYARSSEMLQEAVLHAMSSRLVETPDQLESFMTAAFAVQDAKRASFMASNEYTQGRLPVR